MPTLLLLTHSFPQGLKSFPNPHYLNFVQYSHFPPFGLPKFGKVGEHSGPFASLAVSGKRPALWSKAAWSLNPTILTSAITTPEDKLDRPGLFIRSDEAPPVIPAFSEPQPPSAKLVDGV